MSSIDQIKLHLLDHFIDSSWDIWVTDDQVQLIVAEMPFLDVYDANEIGGIGGKCTMKVKKVRQPTLEESALYYKDWHDFYKNRCNRLENAMEEALNS